MQAGADPLQGDVDDGGVDERHAGTEHSGQQHPSTGWLAVAHPSRYWFRHGRSSPGHTDDIGADVQEERHARARAYSVR